MKLENIFEVLNSDYKEWPNICEESTILLVKHVPSNKEYLFEKTDFESFDDTSIKEFNNNILNQTRFEEYEHPPFVFYLCDCKTNERFLVLD